MARRGRKPILDAETELRVGAHCERLMRSFDRDVSDDLEPSLERGGYRDFVEAVQAVPLDLLYTPPATSLHPWDTVIAEQLDANRTIPARRAVTIVANGIRPPSDAPDHWSEPVVDAVEALWSMRLMYGELKPSPSADESWIRRDRPVSRFHRRRSRGRALGAPGHSIRQEVIQTVATAWSDTLGVKLTARRTEEAWRSFRKLCKDLSEEDYKQKDSSE